MSLFDFVDCKMNPTTDGGHRGDNLRDTVRGDIGGRPSEHLRPSLPGCCGAHAQWGLRALVATRLPLGLALLLASMASVRANSASGSRE